MSIMGANPLSPRCAGRPGPAPSRFAVRHPHPHRTNAVSCSWTRPTGPCWPGDEPKTCAKALRGGPTGDAGGAGLPFVQLDEKVLSRSRARTSGADLSTCSDAPDLGLHCSLVASLGVADRRRTEQRRNSEGRLRGAYRRTRPAPRPPQPQRHPGVLPRRRRPPRRAGPRLPEDRDRVLVRGDRSSNRRASCSARPRLPSTVPGPGQLAYLPILAVIVWRTRSENLRHRSPPGS